MKAYKIVQDGITSVVHADNEFRAEEKFLEPLKGYRIITTRRASNGDCDITEVVAKAFIPHTTLIAEVHFTIEAMY